MVDSPPLATRIAQFCNLLLRAETDIARNSIADDIASAYSSLDADGRDAFLTLLARDFANASDGRSRRRDVLSRLSADARGAGLLIELRGHLLGGLDKHPAWLAVDEDLGLLLRAVVTPEFLEFRRIDLDAEPALLQNLMQFEAVHRMRTWRELERRLQPDRRCFGLFHPALPNKPVVFTEVALTDAVNRTVQPLLDPDAPVVDPQSCRCAIFYSISNCHEGLRGMGFGGALIRQGAEALRAELAGLRALATLSPIPGFRQWLGGLARTGDRTAGELVGLLDDVSWVQQPVASLKLKRQLIPLCAYYLLRARFAGQPADPVARFHIGNGARLDRVNWLGDTSESGIRRSAGLAVNYRYSLEDLDANQNAYDARGTIVASLRVMRSAHTAERQWHKMVPQLGAGGIEMPRGELSTR